MKKDLKKVCLLFICWITGIISPEIVQAQQISGRVADRQREPIEGVAIVMQTLDSVFVDGAVTDSAGVFRFAATYTAPHRLIFQHILYKTLALEIAQAEVGEVALDESDYELEGIVVRGERPMVRIEDGAFSYDVQRLISERSVSTAYEVIRELPGIMEQGGSLSLIGSRSLHVIVNGQLTTMTLGQMLEALKSVPASRIKKAEVMYNAPARYNLNGAVINITLDTGEDEGSAFQGEAGIQHTQQHYNSERVHANLLFNTPKLSVDLLVNANYNRIYNGEEMIARHTLGDEVTEVDQSSRRKTTRKGGTTRLGVDYTFANEDRLSASYYLEGGTSDRKSSAVTLFKPMDGSAVTRRDSKGYGPGDSRLQNAHIQYDSHRNLSIGLDYLNYHSPDELYFIDESAAGDKTDMLNTTKQDVNRYLLFLNHSSIVKGWSLSYGAQGSYAVSDNYIEYAYNKGEGYVMDPETLEDNRQQDYAGNVFFELSKQLTPQLSFTGALKVDYFKSDYSRRGEKSTLWEEWTLFPTLSLNYLASTQHILQFNISSDKEYPTYWNLSPQRMPLNSYSEVAGNPYLKPYCTYEAQLAYILKQKYIFVLYAQYEPDYFTQIPYQDDTEMKNVFRYENLDFNMQTGISVILPFKVGSFWDSRLSLTGFRMQQKSGDFHGMSFDRNSYVGVLSLNNTFDLSSKPNIKLTLNGQYVSPGAIQGIYDLGYSYNVSAGVKYTFLNERASLTLDAEDIFRSNYPNKIEINQGNQWSRLKKMNDTQYVRLSFVYKFGGYKAKEHKAVDQSRLGQ